MALSLARNTSILLKIDDFSPNTFTREYVRMLEFIWICLYAPLKILMPKDPESDEEWGQFVDLDEE